jgi:hypothetical protein
MREETLGGTLGARLDPAGIADVGRGGNEPARARALTLVLLLTALGTGDALSAARHKDMRAHRGKAIAVTGHDHRAAIGVRRHARAWQNEEPHDAVAGVPLPTERPAVASLPPDLNTAKQAIELIRKSK